MGRMYALDGKFLTNTAEIRIGDKIYPVDDRVKTVNKLLKFMEENQEDNVGVAKYALELGLGKKAAAELEEYLEHYCAYLEIYKLVVAAMLGEDPKVVEDRFQGAETKA